MISTICAIFFVIFVVLCAWLGRLSDAVRRLTQGVGVLRALVTEMSSEEEGEEGEEERRRPQTHAEWVERGQSLAHDVQDLVESQGFDTVLWVAKADMEVGSKSSFSCPVVLHGGSAADRAQMISILLLTVDELPGGPDLIKSALAQYMERRKGTGVEQREMKDGVDVQTLNWDVKDPPSPEAEVNPCGPGEAQASKG